MSTCIYCGRSPADGVEHWFPRWLGVYRGADTLLERLCRDCNLHLGRTVDTPMSRMGPEALDRYRYQLEGRDTDWEKANPFSYGTQRAEPPTVATARLPGLDFDVLMEDKPGRGKPDRQPQRQVVVRDSAGAEHGVPVRTDCPEDWIAKAVAERGLSGGTLIRIVCEKAAGSEEMRPQGYLPGWFARALDRAFPDARDISWDLPTGGERIELPGAFTSTELRVENEYLRGLAKLAFHYALKQLPWLDGRAETFRALREFVSQGIGEHRSFVDLEAPTFLLAPGGDGRWVRDGHALLLNVGRESVTVFLRSFVKSFYSRPPVRVRLGDTPDDVWRYPVRAQHLCLFESRRDGYDGEMIQVPTVFRDGRWAAVLATDGGGRQ